MGEIKKEFKVFKHGRGDMREDQFSGMEWAVMNVVGT